MAAEEARKAAEQETLQILDSLDEEEKRIRKQALEDAQVASESRRAHVIKDIVDANDYQRISVKKAETIKRLLKNYDGMSSKLRQELKDLGLEITEEGKHYKVTYYGDGRYNTVFAKTPSDNRSYLKSIPAVSKIDYLELKKSVTFFVGENGSGKSTVLKAIADAYGFNPEGSTINYRFSTYEDLSELGSHTRLSRGLRAPFGYFFRAESIFNLATQAEEYDEGHGYSFGDRNMHEYSHGESFWAFFNKYNGAGLYLMDEPEAALSPQRQLSLLIHIKRMVDVGSQFIIITHSPIQLGFPDADIISFDEGEVHRISYEETESYQVAEMFINNRKQLLHRLLDD